MNADGLCKDMDPICSLQGEAGCWDPMFFRKNTRLYYDRRVSASLSQSDLIGFIEHRGDAWSCDHGEHDIISDDCLDTESEPYATCIRNISLFSVMISLEIRIENHRFVIGSLET